MAIKVPNGGELKMLDALYAGFGSFLYCLYQNNITPADADTAATYTAATYDGYAHQVASMGAAATVSGEAEISAADLVFACTGNSTPNTVYGYFVLDGFGNLLFAERFGSAATMAGSGDTVTVTPKLRLRSIA